MTTFSALCRAFLSEEREAYAEHMMREQGFFADPRHELYQVEAMLFRAARISSTRASTPAT